MKIYAAKSTLGAPRQLTVKSGKLRTLDDKKVELTSEFEGQDVCIILRADLIKLKESVYYTRFA